MKFMPLPNDTANCSRIALMHQLWLEAKVPLLGGVIRIIAHRE
jgi:hypothetical protein